MGATTCENGITHAATAAAAVSMGETSRVYFIPVQEETDRPSGIIPTPASAAARRPPVRHSLGVTECVERRAEGAHCALALISIRGIVRTGWVDRERDIGDGEERG